ncbi:MAG TPA: GNAT family N-acetyltransferase [Pyrinomonadaceae bacterium]|nr:GNAT family N-acetyltransferase [Pyrinomonadaceae bacterium]
MHKTETGMVEISNDRSRIDVDMIHRFLTTETYWAQTRTYEQTRAAIANSLCFSAFVDGVFAGFGRVVSDFATFAYVGDVFVFDRFRGQGIGKLIMQAMVDHPDLQGLRRWLLATRDAHGLYEQYEFSPLKFPERWMERTAPDAY